MVVPKVPKVDLLLFLRKENEPDAETVGQCDDYAARRRPDAPSRRQRMQTYEVAYEVENGVAYVSKTTLVKSAVANASVCGSG